MHIDGQALLDEVPHVIGDARPIYLGELSCCPLEDYRADPGKILSHFPSLNSGDHVAPPWTIISRRRVPGGSWENSITFPSLKSGDHVPPPMISC